MPAETPRISTSVVLERQKQVREVMRAAQLDALVVYAAATSLAHSTTTSGNVRYLANWAGKSVASVLVFPLEADPVLLVTSPLNRRRAEELGAVRDVRQLEWIGGAFSEGAGLREVLVERGVSRGRVGLVGRVEMTSGMYAGLVAAPAPWEFVDADDLVARLRMIKSPEEIEHHRIASSISDAMLYAGMLTARGELRWASDVMCETEVAGRRLGAEFAWCWVATGPAPDFIRNQLSELRHQIRAGDRVQVGTYIAYEGYWGHGLRMGIKGGRPSAGVRRYFEAILDVQNAGLEALRPGKRLIDVARAMQRKIDDYSPYTPQADPFRFRSGHGLGLQYSDPLVTDAFPQPASWHSTVRGGSEPTTSVRESALLVQPGMVLELHPNFSVPELGFFCIGDVVLVTPDGPQILTRFPRELFEI